MSFFNKSKMLDRAVLIGALTALSWGIAQAGTDASPKEAFMKLDADGDGFISAREAVVGKITTEAFQAADRDRDGKLAPEEFAGMFQDKTAATKQP